MKEKKINNLSVIEINESKKFKETFLSDLHCICQTPYF